MSGSLVLRSGVGTQMLMVSSSATAAKSVVARILPASHQRLQNLGGNVLNVRLAAIDRIHLGRQHVDAGDVESGVRQFHRQRQPYVAQSHHAGRAPCGSRSSCEVSQNGSLVTS